MLHQSHISKRAPLLATYPSESDKVGPIPLHVCCACAYIMLIALQNGAVKVSYYGNVIFLLRFGFAVGWYLLITLLMVGSSPCCWMVFAHHPCCWMGFAHHPADGRLITHHIPNCSRNFSSLSSPSSSCCSYVDCSLCALAAGGRPVYAFPPLPPFPFAAKSVSRWASYCSIFCFCCSVGCG